MHNCLIESSATFICTTARLRAARLPYARERTPSGRLIVFRVARTPSGRIIVFRVGPLRKSMKCYRHLILKSSLQGKEKGVSSAVGKRRGGWVVKNGNRHEAAMASNVMLWSIFFRSRNFRNCRNNRWKRTNGYSRS